MISSFSTTADRFGTAGRLLALAWALPGSETVGGSSRLQDRSRSHVTALYCGQYVQQPLACGRAELSNWPPERDPTAAIEPVAVPLGVSDLLAARGVHTRASSSSSTWDAHHGDGLGVRMATKITRVLLGKHGSL